MTHDRSMLRLGAWSGFLYIGVFGLGWWILAHYIPPISPNASAAEVAHRYADHHVMMMIAAVFIMVSSIFLFPLGALCTLLVRKVEGGIGMLTLMLAFWFVALAVLNFFTGLAFAVAAFRPERSPDLVQAFNDFGISLFIGGTPLFAPIWWILAYVILTKQERGNELIPRWFGYFNLLIGVLFLPEVLIYIFHSGPFAWNGVVGWWIPCVLLISYCVATPYVLLPAVRRYTSD